MKEKGSSITTGVMASKPSLEHKTAAGERFIKPLLLYPSESILPLIKRNISQDRYEHIYSSYMLLGIISPSSLWAGVQMKEGTKNCFRKQNLLQQLGA